MCVICWSKEPIGLRVHLIDEVVEYHIDDNLQYVTINGVIENNTDDEKYLEIVHRYLCNVTNVSNEWLDPDNRYNRLFGELPGRGFCVKGDKVTLSAIQNEVTITARPLSNTEVHIYPDANARGIFNALDIPVPFTNVRVKIGTQSVVVIRLRFEIQRDFEFRDTNGHRVSCFNIESPGRTLETIKNTDLFNLYVRIRDIKRSESFDNSQKDLAENINNKFYHEYFLPMTGTLIVPVHFHVTVIEDPQLPMFLERGGTDRVEKRVLENWQSEAVLHHFRPDARDFLICLVSLLHRFTTILEQPFRETISRLNQESREMQARLRDSADRFHFIRLALITVTLCFMILLPAFRFIDAIPRITLLGIMISGILILWLNNAAIKYKLSPVINGKIAYAGILALLSLTILNILSLIYSLFFC